MRRELIDAVRRGTKARVTLVSLICLGAKPDVKQRPRNLMDRLMREESRHLRMLGIDEPTG